MAILNILLTIIIDTDDENTLSAIAWIIGVLIFAAIVIAVIKAIDRKRNNDAIAKMYSQKNQENKPENK